MIVSKSFLLVRIKMDIMDLISIKASLSKHFHIQPSEIDNMAVWEYELYVKCLNDLVKEENDSQEKEMKKYKIDEHMKMANPNNLQKMANPKMPNMPNMRQMKMPK